LHQVSTIQLAVDAGADSSIAPGELVQSTASFNDTGSKGYVATVDWGDSAGVEHQTVTSTTVPLVHQYKASGTYTVNVSVCDDAKQCGSDTRTVTVTEPVEPRVSIGDATGLEGTTKNRGFDFAVTLSRPAPVDTIVGYTIRAEAGDTAKPGADFRARTGTLTVREGRVSAFVIASVKPDAIVEPSETFTVRLTSVSGGSLGDASGVGRIFDGGDGTASPRLAIANASISEGDEIFRNVRGDVTLSRELANDATLTWSTVNGTALSGSDYRGTSGTLRLRAGAVAASITIRVFANDVSQGDRSFGIKLGALPAGVSVVSGTSTITILDDD
jgi:PKD repeat protein